LNHKNKIFLIILDGFGINPKFDANAVHLANTPFLKSMYSRYSWTTLRSSGTSVGLPEGLMGNSEVGHLNIGAGRIVNQDITRIDEAIQDGSFFENSAIQNSIRHARDYNTPWHLIGLVSDGGVHSSLDHLYALLELAKSEEIDRVYLHALLDGRDTSPTAGVEYIRQVEDRMANIGVGKIVSVCGRYWAMDRDRRWDRVEDAYHMLTAGEGEKFRSADEAIQASYLKHVTDEFVKPSVIVGGNGKPVSILRRGDAVMFFNFRADRARELTVALTSPEFREFRTENLNLHFSTMTQYRYDFDFPVAFGPEQLEKILAEVLSSNSLKQLRIAETEKYAHVTFFFNGGEDTAFPGEDRELIPSPKVATYDLKPEMSAPEVTQKVIESLEKDYSFILLNFANPDMVGHTGVQTAIIEALEVLDSLVEKLVKKALGRGFKVLLTSDHGNCEQMIDDDGEPHTAHTTNRVPFILFDPTTELRSDGILADVAPTILKLLGIEQPVEMTGKSLIKQSRSAV